MNYSNVTPQGLYKHAVSFSSVAKHVHKSNVLSDDPLPQYFLWGRAIELALKSYLLANDVTIKTLKSNDYGHDLVALMKLADEKGLVPLIEFKHADAGILQVLNYDYMSKRFEYRETDANYCLPNIELTQQFMNRLLKGVDHYLKKG